MRETIRVSTLREALEAKRAHPGALAIAGGTGRLNCPRATG